MKHRPHTFRSILPRIITQSCCVTVYRRHAHLITLAVFIAGGVVGPAVHKVEHGIKDSQARLSALAASHVHRHSGNPVVCSAPSGPIYHDAYCLLCKTSPDKLTPGSVGAADAQPEAFFDERESGLRSTPIHDRRGRSPPSA